MILIMTCKYQIIYADPAWKYNAWSKKTDKRTAASHYSVSSLDEMKRIPVKRMADKNCALFMWATFPNILEAFELGEYWGFEYKTAAFVWVKRCKKAEAYFTGLGHYTRANAEVCLLFMKGRLERKSKSVRQICDARIRQHSRKPDEIRERIVELFGDLPRIELFSRITTEGWDTYGNQTDLFDDEFPLLKLLKEERQ